MHKPTLTVLLSLTLLGGCAAPAARASKSASALACEKTVLPNGMTVILQEDHSLPLAAVNLWYHVGSKDEREGRTGFAHLFEHLMFTGTSRAPDFDVVMEQTGWSNNATTGEDRTNFFENGPAAALPRLLWLEADRLESLGRDMTQEKLDRQRAVVLNERRQTCENPPYAKSELLISELMYPPGHPYRHSVIGSHEDIQDAVLGDVKAFFETRYVPNNASLVVAGDFDPKTIKPLIAGLFGSLPRRAEAPHAQAPPVRLDREIRCSLTDKVQHARTTMVWHSPAAYAEGDAELDLASSILASGKSSRLYQRLVCKEGLATDVGANQGSLSLGSLFTIQATAKPGVSLDRLEAVIDEEVARLCREGPEAEELARFMAAVETGTVSGLQGLGARADRLNAYENAWGNPDSLERDLDRYRRATPASVRAWASKVLAPDARLVMRVVPEEAPEVPDLRGKAPEAAAERPFAPPEPETCTLDNGITVHHWRRPGLPLTSLQLLVRGGAALDPADKTGLSSLTAEMLGEGAGDLDSLRFSQALDRLGAAFSAEADQEAFRVDLTVLTRHWNEALKLCADAVLKPRMDGQAWERVKTLRLESLKQAEDDPGTVARRVGARAFFGDAHPYGRSVQGTAASVDALAPEDLSRCRRERFRRDAACFLTAGDLSLEEVRRSLNAAFAAWPADGGPAPAPPSSAAPERSALQVVLVDKPGSVQTVVRLLLPGPAYADPRRPALGLLNSVLGGSFTSRLNHNLREVHGYTYGAHSGFAMEPSVGFFVAHADVQTDKTGEALKEFFKEVRGIRQGDVTEAELARAKSGFRAETVSAFSSLDGILGAAAVLALNRRPFCDLAGDAKTAAVTSIEQVNALAREDLPLEQGLLVLVGDRKAVLDQWKGLDLPVPEELTVTGEAKK